MITLSEDTGKSLLQEIEAHSAFWENDGMVLRRLLWTAFELMIP